MTDNYKEFKKWVSEKAMSYKNTDLASASVTMDLLIEFEKEQVEKDKERQVKEILARVIFGWSIKDLAKFEKDKINRIYNDLKEKDLIK